MIPRHRTALGRSSLSRPVKRAIEDGLITSTTTVFDFGCGRGDDVSSLRASGISSNGWDPKHSPHTLLVQSDVVNLGYVVNVIEAEAERRSAVISAWELARRVLVVSARMKFEASGQALVPFADGYITSRGTFQKFFDHAELRDWLSVILNEEPVAAAPGIFYVFREAEARESYLAQRVRSRGPVLRASSPEVVFDSYRGLFEAVLPFFGNRGRLPSVHEVPQAADLYAAVPRLETILRALRVSVGEVEFDRLVLNRRQDLLVYLALARFSKRPQLRQLPMDLQLDIRSLFSTYSAACSESDDLLFRVGRRESLESAFLESSVGKATGNGLYLHVSALDRLPVLLRLYEGCARAYIGQVAGANVVKLHRIKPRVSYLSYPDFDRNPHPALIGSLVVDLSGPDVRYSDFAGSEDPPILHRKELLVCDDYPRRRLFAHLTQHEARLGLLAAPERIGRLSEWRACLKAHGVIVRGHRLARVSQAEQ